LPEAALQSAASFYCPGLPGAKLAGPQGIRRGPLDERTWPDTVLLFGGRSFLGGHICRALVSRGFKVLLHSSSTAEFKNLPDLIPGNALEPVVCGFDEHDALRKLIDRSRFVIHGAIPYYMQSLGQSQKRRRDLADFEATLKIIKSSNVQKSVFISISGTVGRIGGGVADESRHLGATPESWGHLRQKLASEKMVLRYAREGLPAVVVNPSMCVGEFDTKPSTGEFFKFIAHCPFALMPDALLNIVDVADVASGTVLALERGTPGARYILSGTNTTMGTLTRRIKELHGKSMPRISVSRRLAVPIAYFFELLNLLVRRAEPMIPLIGVELIAQGSQHLSCEKAAKELGFAPRDAWDAVDRSYRWYTRHRLI
jgi:dihydroflavonol-4-reductase